MPCQTAVTASATTASLPMAPAATTLRSVAGCSMPVEQVHASVPTIAPKAIARSPRPTLLSVPIAAARCGGSQPYRVPPSPNHSPVIRHDHPADVYRDHARHQRCGQQCLHRYRVADQSLPPTAPPVPTLEIDAITTHIS